MTLELALASAQRTLYATNALGVKDAVKMTVACTFDGSMEAYRARVASQTSRDGWYAALKRITPSPKFDAGAPRSFPGVTLMMPINEERDPPGALRTHLVQAQGLLVDVMGSALLPVNPEQFHVTGADLVAGCRFAEDTEQHIQRVVNDRLTGLGGQGRWCWSGVALFEHAVVALLSPSSADAYLDVVDWRQRVYEEPQLRKMGVRQPRPLMLHVTLGYFSTLPEYGLRSGWLDAWDALRPLYDSNDHGVDVRGFDLYRFKDMATFHAVV